MANAVILLVETAQGATVAVRFPSQEAAAEWADQNDTKCLTLGQATVVSAREALRLANER